MRTFSIVFFSMLLLACNENGKIDSSNKNEKLNIETQDSLAFELCLLYGFDQGIRDREIIMDLHKDLGAKIDLINFDKFISIVQKYGYPNEQLLGKKNWTHQCVSSSGTAIMLHNPSKIIYSTKYFDLFMSEVNKGNMDREFFATVLDKYYWSISQGRKVMYGSQFGVPCMETKDETNKLRKEIGLEPLKDNEFKVCD